MESAVVKPAAVPPLVVATLESSSSRLLGLLPAPTVSNLFLVGARGGGGTALSIDRKFTAVVRLKRATTSMFDRRKAIILPFFLSRYGNPHLENAENISSAALVKYPVSAFAGIPNMPGVSSGKDFSMCMLYRW